MKVAPHDQLVVAQTYAGRRPAADPRLAAKQFAAALDETGAGNDKAAASRAAYTERVAEMHEARRAETAPDRRSDAPPPPGSYLDLRV